MSKTKTPPELTAKGAASEPQADKVFCPQKRDAKPSKLTAEQYLRRADYEEAICALIRSMYGKKIMSFTEWETTVKNLLKKQVR